MKDIGEGTIRRIDWTELTPVVLLLRVFSVALGLRVLAIALLGLWLTVMLNSLAGILFLDQGWPKPDHWEIPQLNVPLDIFQSIWQTTLSIRQSPILLLWLPGFILIWSLCGGVICRIVAVRLTVNESESTVNLLRFIRKRGIGFVSSIIILSLGIFCCFLPLKITGWLMAVPVLNYVIAILFPIPLLFAFLTVVLALGLAVGWMLLFAAVSTDGSDGFDAISRMFSYIFQRPLHYVLYWICCGVLGWLGFLLVQFLTYATIHLCWNVTLDNHDFLVSFWLTIVLSLPVAYAFAWFWTSSIAIYLLLRRSVDATPFSEVYRVAPPKMRTLPTIKQDERGAPEIKQTEPQVADTV